MKQAKSDILHINLVCYSLKEFGRSLCAVKLGDKLRITCYREIAPLRFLAFLHIVGYLETFLYKVYLKMENGNHLSFKYTSWDF